MYSDNSLNDDSRIERIVEEVIVYDTYNTEEYEEMEEDTKP